MQDDQVCHDFAMARIAEIFEEVKEEEREKYIEKLLHLLNEVNSKLMMSQEELFKKSLKLC